MTPLEQKREIERRAFEAARALQELCKILPANDPDWFVVVDAYASAKRIYEQHVCDRFGVADIKAVTHAATEEMRELTPITLLRPRLPFPRE